MWLPFKCCIKNLCSWLESNSSGTTTGVFGRASADSCDGEREDCFLGLEKSLSTDYFECYGSWKNFGSKISLDFCSLKRGGAEEKGVCSPKNESNYPQRDISLCLFLHFFWPKSSTFKIYRSLWIIKWSYPCTNNCAFLNTFQTVETAIWWSN